MLKVLCWGPAGIVLGPYVYVGSSRDDPVLRDLWTAALMHDTSQWANFVRYAVASLMFDYCNAAYFRNALEFTVGGNAEFLC